ncbi:MAG: glycosyltransferase [Tepidisphaeraceae bacterium]
MLNVLHVISGIDPQNGGPTRALLGLTAAQAKLGLQVRVATTYRQNTGPDNAPQFEAANVPVTLIGPAWGPPSWHPKLTGTLTPLIRSADIVHIQALFEEIQHRAAALCRTLNKPYIMRPCGGLDPWALARGRLKKRLYLAWRLRRDLNGAAAIHYTTAAEARSAEPLGLTAPTIVEPNGIDLSEFDPLPAKGLFRAKHPQIAGRRIILFLGRIDPKKGLDLLIPAFARAQLPDAVLVLAGPDSFGYQQQMQALAQREGVAPQVLFPGMLHGRERIEALVDADLFVMPSYVENFGISVIEALAAGVNTIVSEKVNLVDELPSGTVARVGIDIDGLSAAIRSKAASDINRHDNSMARRQLAARYSWTEMAKHWQRHYNALIR